MGSAERERPPSRSRTKPPSGYVRRSQAAAPGSSQCQAAAPGSSQCYLAWQVFYEATVRDERTGCLHWDLYTERGPGPPPYKYGFFPLEAPVQFRETIQKSIRRQFPIFCDQPFLRHSCRESPPQFRLSTTCSLTGYQSSERSDMSKHDKRPERA